MTHFVPKISNQFVCICRLRDKRLTAIALSYILRPNQYVPVFGFPETTAQKKDEPYDPYDIHHLSTSRAEEFSIRVHNALQRVGGCDHLILIGLTDQQISFLDFTQNYNTITVQDEIEVEFLLRPLTTKYEYLECPEEQICEGLYKAALENKILRINNQATVTIDPTLQSNHGIVIAEDVDNTSPVIAVNYALAFGLNLQVIKPPRADRFEIAALVKEWRDTQDPQHLNDLGSLLHGQVESIDFNKYPFATFFTSGSPYSLTLRNVTPFSYVHLDLYPDLFIFNNLYRYHNEPLGSAIVFSPLLFKDEETQHVISVLERMGNKVVPLIDHEATTTNLEYCITEYPFNTLHICSHGGEIQGHRFVERFHDLDGNEHTIEYDEVVGLIPVPGSTLFEVLSMKIWRKLDGLRWKSKELKDKGYPHSLYSEMLKKTQEKKKRDGIKVDRVEGSRSIKCKFSIYQALFNAIAGGTEIPFIFNNTCWSWSGIADPFLSVGASSYIGTIWDVDNPDAVLFAESFYNRAQSSTILTAFYESLETIKGTKSENAYALWGLHFSKLPQNHSTTETRLSIARRLIA